LIPTILIFGFVRDARKKLRPMRPKPLIPTLITVRVLATKGASNRKAQLLVVRMTATTLGS
jgi:hypothetical protein